MVQDKLVLETLTGFFCEVSCLVRVYLAYKFFSDGIHKTTAGTGLGSKQLSLFPPGGMLVTVVLMVSIDYMAYKQ